MRITLDSALQISDDLFSARLFPIDAKRLSGSPVERGMRTIVLVDEVELGSDDEGLTLTADASSFQVVSLGWSDRAVIVVAPFGAGSDPLAFITSHGSASRARD